MNDFATEFYKTIHDLWLCGDIEDTEYLSFMERAIKRNQIDSWFNAWNEIKASGFFDDVTLISDYAS